jgi:hypothetical protein
MGRSGNIPYNNDRIFYFTLSLPLPPLEGEGKVGGKGI